jgi:hypothetical protein
MVLDRFRWRKSNSIRDFFDHLKCIEIIVNQRSCFSVLMQSCRKNIRQIISDYHVTCAEQKTQCNWILSSQQFIICRHTTFNQICQLLLQTISYIEISAMLLYILSDIFSSGVSRQEGGDLATSPPAYHGI